MKELLVVVDYQNDFVSGSLGFEKAASLEDAICHKIEAYRSRGADVVFTFDTHDADYLNTQEGKCLPVVHCVRGTPGWQLCGRVAGYCGPDTVCFYKPVFGSRQLADYAGEQGYDAVELCGLVSNICVLSNAVLIKAALPETVVTVDAQCTSCADEAMNQKALDVMEGLQIQVINR